MMQKMISTRCRRGTCTMYNIQYIQYMQYMCSINMQYMCSINMQYTMQNMTNTQCRRGTCTRENLQGEGQQDIGYKVYHANHDPSDNRNCNYSFYFQVLLPLSHSPKKLCLCVSKKATDITLSATTSHQRHHMSEQNTLTGHSFRSHFYSAWYSQLPHLKT